MIDYDLEAALRENSLSEYIDRINTVLGVVEGENDGNAWHWIVLLNNPVKVAYITGSCDYTGWDCQSNCYVTEFDTIIDALGDVEVEEHYKYGFDVQENLLNQIVAKKANLTWRQQILEKYPEFNLPIVDFLKR